MGNSIEATLRMQRNERLLGRGIGAAFAAILLGSLAAPPTASAAGYNIEGDSYHRTTYSGRCELASKAFCLWYSYSAKETGISYFAEEYGSVTNNDLLPANTALRKKFTSAGSGSGQVVGNNAAAMDCTIYVSRNCYVYYSKNKGGNYDWTGYGVGGRLNYTWNNDRSYWVD
jgi:hypothetical protein